MTRIESGTSHPPAPAYRADEARTVQAAGQAAPHPQAPRPRRRLAGPVIALTFIAAMLLHVLFDRFAPYTSEASLQAPVIAVAPNVSGTLVEALVRDNQTVAAGDVLARIDPSRFAAALAQAEANLEDAIQRVGASASGLGTAQARVTEAEAALVNQRQQTARVVELARRRVYSEAQADTARAQLASAEAGLQSAVAALKEAEERLGARDANNPLVRAARAALDRARIDMMDTDIRAPVDGAVTNTVLSPGQFAAAGRRVATIVDTASAWVIANIPENALTRVKPGDAVEITFNVRPGTIVRGRVESIAFGVSQGLGVDGELARVEERRRWLRETQRIPVRIEMERAEDAPAIRVGSRASVVVLTEEGALVAPLARAWLRAVSVFNYLF
jgi:multidrug resistance efflux pump